MTPQDGRPTILVVDDSETMTQLFATLLAPVGTVAVTHSGKEGLEKARELAPDIILLDVQMPGWDGFDVINELKLDPTLRHIPVIFITGEVIPEIESHCLESGGADYIAKPITPRVLVARVQTHLLLKQQADQLADQSFRDPVTGALSPWAFEELLGSELDRAAWRDWPTSVLIVGFDEFDEYSLAYGHVAAADAMATAVEIATGVARRPGDRVGLLTIDKMIVLLPQTTAEEAAAMAERILGGVRDRGIKHSRSTTGTVTVSIGGVQVRGSATPTEVERAAEVQLQDARGAGGGQVRVLGGTGAA